MASAEDIAKMNEKLEQLLARAIREYRAENDEKVAAQEKKIDGNTERIAALESRLSELESRRSEVNNSSTAMELMKQMGLRNNVCIHGVPSMAGEGLVNIVLAIGVAISVAIAADDISSVSRAKASAQSPGLIIVKFKDFKKKLEYLSKEALPRLTVDHLKIANIQSKKLLCVNQQMTPYISAVFYRARAAVREGFFKACWLSDHGIAFRMHDDSTKTVTSGTEIETPY